MSDLEKEHAVTLFIQGHGTEDIDTEFDNKDNNTELLSFVGMPGKSGKMNFCGKNKEPIDMIVLRFLYNQYENHNTIKKENQKQLFEFIPSILPDIYKYCSITIDNGFTLTYPIYDRVFYFSPNEHENCRKCIEPIYSSTKLQADINAEKRVSYKRCIQERDINNIICPEYGLTVVSSSFPEDKLFTLSGVTYNKRNDSNMNMRKSNILHWKNRASPEFKGLVDQIYNDKEISLIEIKDLFRSMGFTKIYIIDPTCRSCEIDPVKAQEIRDAELDPIKADIYRISKKRKREVIPSPIPKVTSPNFIQYCYSGVCSIFRKSKSNKKSKSKSNKIGGNKTKKMKFLKKLK